MFARVPLHQEAEPQTKSLEDLEFQKLEGEINHAEESDSPNQELLREIAEYQRLAVTRKVQHRFYHPESDICHCVSTACSSNQGKSFVPGFSGFRKATGNMSKQGKDKWARLDLLH